MTVALLMKPSLITLGREEQRLCQQPASRLLTKRPFETFLLHCPYWIHFVFYGLPISHGF
jgi:hypothetical protein